jgi:hypothetical protein
MVVTSVHRGGKTAGAIGINDREIVSGEKASAGTGLSVSIYLRHGCVFVERHATTSGPHPMEKACEMELSAINCRCLRLPVRRHPAEFCSQGG